jgi:hypothetical protein
LAVSDKFEAELFFLVDPLKESLVTFVFLIHILVPVFLIKGPEEAEDLNVYFSSSPLLFENDKPHKCDILIISVSVLIK